MDELVIFSLLAADLRKNEWKEAKRFTIIKSHYFAVGFCINVRSISWHTGTQDIWCHLVTANCQVYLDVTNIFIMFSLHIKDLDGRGGRHMGKQGGWHHLSEMFVCDKTREAQIVCTKQKTGRYWSTDVVIFDPRWLCSVLYYWDWRMLKECWKTWNPSPKNKFCIPKHYLQKWEMPHNIYIKT